MIDKLLERAREESELRGGERPLFLERRDSRGLFPELFPPQEIVNAIRRIDPRWRIEWNRILGRWCMFHDHERFGKAKMVTHVVQTSDRKYLPLDHRTVSRVAWGAYAERNGYDPVAVDEAIQTLINDRDEAIEQHNSDRRRDWLKANARGINQHMRDGTFFDPDPEPARPVHVDYGAH